MQSKTVRIVYNSLCAHVCVGGALYLRIIVYGRISDALTNKANTLNYKFIFFIM